MVTLKLRKVNLSSEKWIYRWKSDFFQFFLNFSSILSIFLKMRVISWEKLKKSQFYCKKGRGTPCVDSIPVLSSHNWLIERGVRKWPLFQSILIDSDWLNWKEYWFLRENWMAPIETNWKVIEKVSENGKSRPFLCQKLKLGPKSTDFDISDA